VEFIETPVFTKQVRRLLSSDSYRGLQLALVFRPGQGSVVPGTGGLRKLRWRDKGQGKRGGVRVVYYWIPEDETIYLLAAYSKSERADLTPDQTRILRRLVREELE